MSKPIRFLRIERAIRELRSMASKFKDFSKDYAKDPPAWDRVAVASDAADMAEEELAEIVNELEGRKHRERLA